MNGPLLFDSPFLLGFEHIRGLIERAAKAAESYPPYNVEDAGDGGVRITVAVAGFTGDQLSVTLEDNQLTVTGRRDNDDERERVFVHRGIAGRGFVRGFILADGMEVAGARLEHGLLQIDAIRRAPAGIVKQVPIQTTAEPGGPAKR